MNLRFLSLLLLATSLPFPAAAQYAPSPEEEMALAAARQGNLALWQEMLKLGASPHARDASGNNALVMAVLSEREDVLREVLSRQVDPNARGNTGMTALGVAVTRGHADTVHRLLAAGARPDVADATGATPLIAAVRRGSVDIASMLIAAGADVDRADDAKLTALHLAAERGNLTLMRVLLDAGADPNRLDGEKRSPLFLALFEQHAEAAELLIRHRHTDVQLITQGYAPRAWASQTGHEDLASLIDQRLAR